MAYTVDSNFVIKILRSKVIKCKIINIESESKSRDNYFRFLIRFLLVMAISTLFSLSSLV